MSNELLNNINNNNYKIINELIELLIDEKINTNEELKKYQNDLFAINGNNLNHAEQLKYCIKNIKTNGLISENTDFADIQRIELLKKELDTENELILTKNIIVLYSMLNKEMMLPYDAYNLIINGEL